jgi:transcriptional regulator with XRE-family HTH domain
MKFLKAHMKARGLTEINLCGKMQDAGSGISPQTIARLTNNRDAVPSHRTLLELRDALGITLDELLAAPAK